MQGLSKRSSQDSGNSSRLLIVDDDGYLRVSLRQQLLAEGFQHIYDIGTAAGLNTILKDANPDLILLDIQMPDGNGVEICKQLRSGGFSKPIVMLTAKNAEVEIIEGFEAGANDYIAKPSRMGE